MLLLRTAAVSLGLVLLLLAGPGWAQATPPPSGLPEVAPPFGLPKSAPPFGRGKAFAFGLGKGMGKGSAVSAVSYQCLGVETGLSDAGSSFSYLSDEIALEAQLSPVYLDAAAAGDLVKSGGISAPIYGAAAGVETGGMLLQPFDLCSSTAESALDSVVVGTHLTDAGAAGVADVEFVFDYEATLETHSLNGSNDFVAFVEADLVVLGLTEDSFVVSAEGAIVEAPPELSVTDLSDGDHHVYEISGTYVISGQLSYGPGAYNVVTTSLLAGVEAAGVQRAGRSIVAGYASVDAIDAITYEVVSLNPDVSFSFVAAASTGAD